MQNVLTMKPEERVATIAVFIRDGKTLLGLREYSPEKGGASVWTAPGGSVDAGETVETALRRETEEEVGFSEITITDYIGEVNAENRDKLFVFLAEAEGEVELCEPEKFAEWRWFSLEDFAAGEPKNYISEPAREKIVTYARENDMLEI